MTTTTAPTTPCHVCGQDVKLREATPDEAYEHGFDRVEGYLIGRCHKTHHPDGTRAHYTKPVTVIYHTDLEG